MNVQPDIPWVKRYSPQLVTMLLELNRVSLSVHGGREATINEAMSEILNEIARRGEMDELRQALDEWETLPSVSRERKLNWNKANR